jgi:hypothetical protein
MRQESGDGQQADQVQVEKLVSVNIRSLQKITRHLLRNLDYQTNVFRYRLSICLRAT